MLPNIVVINITAKGSVASDLSGANVRPTRAEQVTTSETALIIKPCDIANNGVFLKNDVIINGALSRWCLFYTVYYSEQKEACWIGGQGKEPNEQNTQQSLVKGLSDAPHALQS